MKKSKKVEDIAFAWIELHSYEDETPEYKSRLWASEALNVLVYSDLRKVWEIVLKILELTDSELMLELVGTGPLEDMMCENDELTLNLIRKEIGDNARLRLSMKYARLDKSDTKLYIEFFKLAGVKPPFE
jgi:hypothetical protein